MEDLTEAWISVKKIPSGYEQSFKGIIPTTSPLWKPDNSYQMNGECSYIADDYTIKTWKCDDSSHVICQMKPQDGITEQIYD